MSNGKIDLTRRKVLAGLGAIGAASAGVGMGTSAYFSDVETFTNNKLVAGELDLKVDWEEHYSDWSDDEADGIETVSMEPEDGLVGFPSTTENKSVYVSVPQQFLENTAIESFPDVVNTEDPGSISAEDYDGLQVPIDDAICDFPADLDGVLSHPFRTGANVTGGVEIDGQTTAAGDPLINIQDVKPGDFGEVTFSFHVCGNPGYVWLTGQLVDASENGLTEPERKDPDEGEGVELLDEIRAAFWYDTGEDGVYGADLEDKDDGEGDNIFGTGETLIPLTGSLRSVLNALEQNMFPLDAEPVSQVNGTTPTQNGNTYPTVSGTVQEGDEYVREIIVTTEDDRFEDGPAGGTPRNYQCPDYESNLEYFESGDIVGSEILNPDNAAIQEGTSYSGCTTITVDDYPNDGTGDITLSSSGPVLIVSVKGGNSGEQVYVFTEPVILDGATFTTPGDHNISNIDVCCPTNGDDDNGELPPLEDGRQCFPNSTTAYVGFEWWLPIDHGNEVQTDSVSFDLGFYTEQCRHNDGSGMEPEEQTNG